MLAVASLLSVLVFSMVVTRIGAVALRLTGMAEDAARFQARSALTGSGFTTSESEQVMAHPVRRQVIGLLMLVGNIGLVAASGTLILSLVGIQQEESPSRLGLLLGGLLLIFLGSRSRWVDRALCGAITSALRRYTDLETRDFTTLLHLRDDYRIAELMVEPTDWLAEKCVGELELQGAGVVTLGIHRKGGEYVGVPQPDQRVEAGDRLVLYGLPGPVAELDCRCEIAGEAS